MSFMFKPYPYDDPTAVNRPILPEKITSTLKVGCSSVCDAIVDKIFAMPEKRIVFLALDGYVGADWRRTIELLGTTLAAKSIKLTTFDVSALYKDSAELETLLADNLPMDREIDPVLLFGKVFHGGIESLFDSDRVRRQVAEWQHLKNTDDTPDRTVICIFGCGAACDDLQTVLDVSAYWDVTPLRVALGVQNGKIRPLGDDGQRDTKYIFRRLYYFDFEMSVRHRQRLIHENLIDFYVDGSRADTPKLLPLAAFKEILATQVKYPFRCKPVYIEGVWGGFFVKKLRNLPSDMKNCAWVFDLIPNEVSLAIKVGRHTIDVPYPTFFRCVGDELMGRECVERFGGIFPIRFNYDDTYAGNGNMSIQVHPPRDYAIEHFNEPFQQDESYYVMKTGGSRTYLGLQDDADTDDFFRQVKKAEAEHIPFDYDKYVNSFESREGDQFLLPGGTIHASGRNQVVLEIGSCTIGSYTFKLYDYLRLDLDGIPRPIHSKHGQSVLNCDRRRSLAERELKPQPKLLREGPGWREFIIGEHDKIFFSLRRLEFDRTFQDDTQGKFHVLNLVCGDEVLVYSLSDPELFFHQKYCEMVVVPAAVGKYGILNLGDTPCKMTKTLLK